MDSKANSLSEQTIKELTFCCSECYHFRSDKAGHFFFNITQSRMKDTYPEALWRNLLNHTWGSNAHSLSVLPVYIPNMTEILLKRM